MHIDIHVSLYAYAAANGATVLCAIKFVIDLRGRAWREGKEERERFILKSLINSATVHLCQCGLRVRMKE